MAKTRSGKLANTETTQAASSKRVSQATSSKQTAQATSSEQTAQATSSEEIAEATPGKQTVPTEHTDQAKTSYGFGNVLVIALQWVCRCLVAGIPAAIRIVAAPWPTWLFALFQGLGIQASTVLVSTSLVPEDWLLFLFLAALCLCAALKPHQGVLLWLGNLIIFCWIRIKWRESMI
jgi:hypothetical protein